ncbi:MAG: hypothetical protein RJP96_02765 [Algiphilus sp.]|uniref:phage tail terminator protein n=1 Tax=Algiphilus sp. TaxID=1872431 RepID=UPI0032EB13E3
MSTDFLGLEPLIVARLKEVAPEGVQVLTVNDLDGVREQSQHTPSYQIHYQQTTPADAADRAPDVVTRQAVTQTWAVVVVTRNAKSQRSGSDARAQASELLGTAIESLLGWLPPGNQFRRLRLAVAPRPQYGAGGVVYFPLLFTTRMELSGATARA